MLSEFDIMAATLNTRIPSTRGIVDFDEAIESFKVASKNVLSLIQESGHLPKIIQVSEPSLVWFKYFIKCNLCGSVACVETVAGGDAHYGNDGDDWLKVFCN